MADKTSIIPIEAIDRRILLIRRQKIMLDSDLAQLYGVSTKRLNEQVKRNRKRFPGDFMFHSQNEKNLRWSQIATTSRTSGFPRFRRMRLQNMERLCSQAF